MMSSFGWDFFCSPKGQKISPKSVKSSQEGRKKSDQQQQVITSRISAAFARFRQAFHHQVFAPETGEQWKACQGGRATEECNVRSRHDLPKAAKLAYVDDPSHRVHHASGREKEQCFEERMCEEVEHCRGDGKCRSD